MSAPKYYPHPCETLGVITEPGESHPFDGSEADWAAFSAACKQRDEALSQVARLREGLDPDTLDAIADEIGSDFKHTARAASLHSLANQARALLAETEGGES